MSKTGSDIILQPYPVAKATTLDELSDNVNQAITNQNRTLTEILNRASPIPDHAPTHEAGGSDPVQLTEAQITGLVPDLTAIDASLAAIDTSLTTIDVSLTTIVASLATKAPLASPSLTGTPTTPTAVVGTSTTQISSTAFVQAAIVASRALKVIDVTQSPYNADPTGAVDCSSIVDQAIFDALPKGGLDRIMMLTYGSGYTSAPTISFTGFYLYTAWVSLAVYTSGNYVSYSSRNYRSLHAVTSATNPASDTTNWEDITPTAVALLAVDQIGAVAITSRGTGIIITGRTAGVTSGSNVITGPGGGNLDTTNLEVNMSVDAENFPTDTIISFVNPGVSITVNKLATGTDAYHPMAFGIPRVVFTGGAGSGATAETICGDPTLILFPPGVYKTGLGWYLNANHNLTISGVGARFYVTGTNPTGFAIWGSCRAVDCKGFIVEHNSAIYGNYPPPSRNNGFGMKYQGSYGCVSNVTVYMSPDFGFGVGRGDGTVATARRARGNRFENCRSIQTCGDGIHFGQGCFDCVAIAHDCYGCGDDSIAIVSDSGVTNQTENIHIIGGTIRCANFRGIAIISSKNVHVSGVKMDVIGGYGIETSAQYGPVCDSVFITGCQLTNVGSVGTPGPQSANRHGINLTNVVNGYVAGNQILGATGAGINLDTLTDVDVGLNSIIGCALGPITRGAALTRVTELRYDTGALKYIGAAGTATTIAAS